MMRKGNIFVIVVFGFIFCIRNIMCVCGIKNCIVFCAGLIYWNNLIVENQTDYE